MSFQELQSTKTILVPVANPQTAPNLLKLAAALVNGDESSVIALFVLRGNLEAETKTLDKLEPLVEQLQAEGCPIKLQTHKASSIARGILDAARDSGSDLIILGVQRSTHNQFVLGTIDENVLTTAPCPVLIYSPSKAGKVGRVVIPTDGTLPAKAASAVGVKLAKYHQIEAEAIYVQPGYRSRWEGLGHIEQSLEDIPGANSVKRTLITAHNPADAVLTRLEPDDLLVVGYSGRSDFERWLMGDFSRQMLNRAHCAIALISPTNTPPLLQRARKSLSRFSFRLTPAEQEDIVRQAYDLSAANLDYLVLIMIAATLASLGLLANSSAVIIGAMLVAPFMQPCIAFAVGMTTAQLALARRAIISLLIGIPVAVAIAALAGLLAQGQPFTSEMLARGNPTILDALVACASGVIGAYATARKEIPSALAGVAIAAALMPPLCTFGLGLTAGNFDLGLRAGLLFLTNIVCIALTAWGVFFLLGLRPVALKTTFQRFNYVARVGLSVLVLGMLGVLLNVSSATNRSRQVISWLAESFLPAQVREVDVQDGVPVRVSVVVRADAPITTQQVSAVEQILSDRLAKPVHLEVIFQQVIAAPDG